MSRTDQLGKTSVIVLCGGLGTRLRPVLPDIPKALAPIGGRPFFDILFSFFGQQGIRHVILAIGHGGEKIKERYAAHELFDVVFSEETTPLGTGGALKKAFARAEGEEAVVMNGDTLCPINYADLVGFHREKQALLTIVVAARNRGDIGGVKLGAGGLVLDYTERPPLATHPFMGAGIYACNREILAHMPDREVFSLEYDVLPGVVHTRRCFGYLTKETPVDIGTPERYAAAQNGIRTVSLME